jgi:TRAP-type C4-dicarboxylate transport system permease small subunit
MRFPRKSHRYDKAYIRMVGIALLPAIGAGIMTQVVGRMLGGSESVVDRVSQIVLPATFFGACYYIRARHPPTTPWERP